MKGTVRALSTVLVAVALIASGFVISHSGAGATPAHKHYRIVIVSKAETIPVFNDVDRGAAVAAKELGDTFTHTGPSTPDATKQHDIIVNNLIPTHPDGIGVSANDPQVVGSALHQAQLKGIKTFSYDSDVVPADRAFFVNQAPIPLVGKQLAKMACQDAPGCKGQIAILSATPTSTNQNAWIKAMKGFMRTHAKYHKLHIVKIAYGNDEPAKSTTETEGLLSAFPHLKVIVAPTSVGIVAAARVVQTKGLRGKVDVTGLCFPSEMALYLRNGVSKQCALWSFKDLGYLAFYAAHYLVAGKITGKPGESFNAGKLGRRVIQPGGVIVLGPLQVYNKHNIGYYLKHASICCG
jgi:rhamnose transport system substrate-binding protein